MKALCPKCQQEVPYKQLFFRNRSRCPTCMSIVTVSLQSRITQFAPILLVVLIGLLGFSSQYLTMPAALWCIVQPFFFETKLSLVSEKK
jgi:uncharacterized protein (DUF983 family)